MCVVSFGLADGLNEPLKVAPHETDDWQQAALGFQDGTLMMAALRGAMMKNPLKRDQ
jgi:hypothetical protein